MIIGEVGRRFDYSMSEANYSLHFYFIITMLNLILPHPINKYWEVTMEGGKKGGR